MLVINSVTVFVSYVSVNFTVDTADIDPGFGSEDYGFNIYRASDNSLAALTNSVNTVSSGVGNYTGTVTTGIGALSGIFYAVLTPQLGSDTVNTSATSTNFPIGVTSMAGTGQGRLFSARCRMQEPNGRKFTLEGNGLDAAGAIGELEAKLALIDARVTVISAVRLTGALSSGQITAFNTVNSGRSTDTGGYDDVDVTLRQVFNAGTATQVIETPVIRIQDAINGIASASIDGTIDVTHTLVAALATAYVDSDGNTGYAAYHGRFVS